MVGEIDELKSFNYEDPKKPYLITLISNLEINQIGDKIMINPFLNLSFTKNELTQKTRTYPVDFVYANDIMFDISLAIPDGYKIAALPEPYDMSNSLADIHTKYELSDQMLHITANYNFKKAIYGSKEYARVKFYINTIIEEFNRELVLEKA